MLSEAVVVVHLPARLHSMWILCIQSTVYDQYPRRLLVSSTWVEWIQFNPWANSWFGYSEYRGELWNTLKFSVNCKIEFYCYLIQSHCAFSNQIFDFHFPKKKENGVTQYSKCTRYVIDWQNLFNISDPDSIDYLQPNTSWPTEPCNNGWVYNKTHVTSSIVIDVRDYRFTTTAIINGFY